MSKPSDSEVLVSCQGISKKFCRNLKKSLWYGVKDGVSEIVRGKLSDSLRKDEFWALDDVSFELRRGECLGLLGRNGAGKTTLLKVLSGLIKPDKGTITLKGKVGGLIALGAGFNGILSGRENIRINGAILGYSREEIEERMQEIIDFAEIPDFIDAPVNTYSSGMSVRLGFAIAAILTKPDVLLLDEVLAVGDIGFTIKCLNAVREMMKNSAVIFVSHNMQFVSQFCNYVLLFERGKFVKDKMETKNGVSLYLDMFPVIRENFKNKKFQANLRLIQDSSTFNTIIYGQEINVILDIVNEFQYKENKFKISLGIKDSNLKTIILYKLKDLVMLNKNHQICLNLGSCELNTGKYTFVVAIQDIDNKTLFRLENLSPFKVLSNTTEWACIIKYV